MKCKNKQKYKSLFQVFSWDVLLIEAGGEEHYVMDIPLVANMLQFTDANWKYKTVPSNDYCLGNNNSGAQFFLFGEGNMKKFLSL